MRAADAGWLLSAIARGGVVELPAEKDELLEALRGRGLVRPAPDPGPERAQLAQLRAELERVAAERARAGADPALVGRERGLRSAIVEISERLAESEGATEVRRVWGAPYRGGAAPGGQRWQLTQRGRTLLSDLGPRSTRVGDAPLDAFAAQMQALRDTFAWRARRAGEIAARLGSREALGQAQNAVPVGLSAVRAEPDRIAQSFRVAFDNVRRASSGFTPEQDAAAAECLCLTVGDVAAAERVDVAMKLVRLRWELLTSHVQDQPEDALDAATMLLDLSREEYEARIATARELAVALRARERAITLTLALVALAGEERMPPHLPSALAELDQALAGDVASAEERMATAVLLAFGRGDPRAQIERWRTLRHYVARFSHDGMAVAAALLSWVALEPAEILDDLRLASAELSKQGLAGGGAETMTLAIKLLVSMAALAAGQEGDHEERLALAPVATPGLPRLGLSGAFATLPLPAMVTAFHRTVLDAAAEWERTFHPTHSSYVFGGSGYRRTGWG